MKVFETKEGYLIRLVRGEEIHASLTAFASERGIRGASVQGIGAVENVEVGVFRPDLRDYDHRQEPGVAELASLNGNLSFHEGRPFLHAHVVLVRPDYSVVGGHLFRAVVAVTGEFSVQQTDLRLRREPDDEVGLALLEADPEGSGA